MAYITGPFMHDSNDVVSDDLKSMLTLEGTLGHADTAGGVMKVANPFGVDVIVTDVIVNVTTKATGACTIDVGVDADGTASSDTLMDGVDVATAAGIFNNVDGKGTNGGKVRLWAKDAYIMASKATGAAAGLVGKYYIKCIVK